MSGPLVNGNDKIIITSPHILTILSTDVENIIMQYASPYISCQGVSFIKVRDAIDSDIRLREIAVAFDKSYITKHYNRIYEPYFEKNGVPLPIPIVHFRMFKVSPNSAELYVIPSFQPEISVYSMVDGHYLRTVTPAFPPTVNRDDFATFDVNNRGQFVFLILRRLTLCVFENDGQLASVTILTHSPHEYGYNLHLMSTEFFDGNIFLSCVQNNSIYVFNSSTGKFKRQMYGDHTAVRLKNKQESRFSDEIISEGAIVDCRGQVVLAFGEISFSFEIDPKISVLGEIFVYKKKHFLVFDSEGKFLRKIKLHDSIKLISSFTLDHLGRIVVCCAYSGSIWLIE